MKRIFCMTVVMMLSAMMYAQAGGTTGQNPTNPGTSGSTQSMPGQTSMPSQPQSMPSTAQSASSSADEQQLIGIEHQWADAMKGGDPSALSRILAEGYVYTDPTGRVSGKTDDISSIRNGQVKFQTFQLSDMQAHVYGDTGVVTGRANIAGTANGRDISGNYAFTDTFVKRNGQWQAVATQITPLSGAGSMAPSSQPPSQQPPSAF